MGSICGAALKIVGRPVILTDINYLKLQTALGDSRILRQLMHKLWVKRSNFCQIIFDIAQRTENYLSKKLSKDICLRFKRFTETVAQAQWVPIWYLRVKNKFKFSEVEMWYWGSDNSTIGPLMKFYPIFM